MMAGNLKCIFRCAAFTLVVASTPLVWAVTPNPLENVYWRFEEGPDGPVTPADSDVVVDSAINPSIPLNHNPLRTPAGLAPSYSSDVPPTPLKSGLANTRSMSFSPNNNLAANAKNIDNGIIAPGGGFTIEAAFRTNALSSLYQAIIVKEGQPADNGAAPKTFNENLPTMALKIRGDSGKLMFEEFDGANQLKSVSSVLAMNPDQWYYAAVVNDGSQMQLYLDSNDGGGYQLQSTVGVSGALYQTNKTTGLPDWTASVVVGRGDFSGPIDWFNGSIDEVRISNTAFDPSRFLFAPGLAADYNNDGFVDTADYVLWRNGPTAAGEHDAWRAHYAPSSGASAGSGISGGAAVPEAASGVMLLTAAVLVCCRRAAFCRRSVSRG